MKWGVRRVASIFGSFNLHHYSLKETARPRSWSSAAGGLVAAADAQPCVIHSSCRRRASSTTRAAGHQRAQRRLPGTRSPRVSVTRRSGASCRRTVHLYGAQALRPDAPSSRRNLLDRSDHHRSGRTGLNRVTVARLRRIDRNRFATNSLADRSAASMARTPTSGDWPLLVSGPPPPAPRYSASRRTSLPSRRASCSASVSLRCAPKCASMAAA